MKTYQKIALIGGTGKSGSYILSELLERGYHVKLLLRNPSKAPTPHPNLEIVSGDVENPFCLAELVVDTDATISALGIGIPQSPRNIFANCTEKIIELKKYEIGYRYLVLTGLNVNSKGDQKGKLTQMATDFMYQNFLESTRNKQLEYELLSSSKLGWTMIRSSLIEQSDTNSEYEVSGSDCKGQKISTSNLARFIVDQIDSEEFLQKAPFIWDK